MPELHPTAAARSTARAFIVISIIGVVLLSVGAYHLRYSRLFINATTHQPERYTELYFSNPAKLPTDIPHSDMLPVGFTVHNVEARNTSYIYEVSLLTPTGQTLVQKQQNLNLKSLDSKTLVTQLPIPAEYRGRGEVQVTLRNLNQSIHFWVEVV
jgi:hypothetical protein